MANVLVVGGAGYIGSAACAHLLKSGHQIWVLDDLSTGRRELVLGGGFTQARAGDRAAVGALLRAGNFDCVMYFAAKTSVAESVREPALYVENNVRQTEALLDEMLKAGVGRFIFSSTCAVFGDVGDGAINESRPKAPINPYGQSKLDAERLIERLASERGLQAIALRYFNAAGAEAGLRVGEWHEPESHLIPLVLDRAIAGRPVQVFGDDYATADGTCVRDYVHVTDLAKAHESAMLRILARPKGQGSFEAFNLGSEQGYSVREVIAACEKATGRALTIERSPRRPGDAPRLVADSRLARRELGFDASTGLEAIVESAWAWQKKHATRGRAVFLDRDGTINEDPGYLDDPAKLRLFPRIPEALGRLKRSGYKLVVVSNQSGVSRGLIRQDVLPKVHEKLNAMVEPHGGEIDLFSICIHHPDENCGCRKPKPKLLVDSAQELSLDLRRSFMVGDKLSDMRAGRAAGCRTVLVRTGSGADAEKEGLGRDADFVADSLHEAAEWILSQSAIFPT